MPKLFSFCHRSRTPRKDVGCILSCAFEISLYSYLINYTIVLFVLIPRGFTNFFDILQFLEFVWLFHSVLRKNFLYSINGVRRKRNWLHKIFLLII